MKTYFKTSYYDATSANGTVACLKRRLAQISEVVEKYPSDLLMLDIPLEDMTKALLVSERLTADFRMNIRDDDYRINDKDLEYTQKKRDKVICEGSSVSAEIVDGVLTIVTPPLLNRRSPKTYSPYLEEAVYAAIRELERQISPEKIPRYDVYTLIYIREYTNFPNRKYIYIPDNDNIESGSISNAIGTSLSVSDRVECASFIYTSMKGTCNRTIIKMIKGNPVEKKQITEEKR